MKFDGLTQEFLELAADITDIGLNWHETAIVENTLWNKKFIRKTLRDIKAPQGKKADSAIIVSAGPSLYKNNILERIKSTGYDGTIIAIDGSYVRSLKLNILPDYILTLDPHPTRLVRWFGDPNFEKNLEGDDYFSRQDLDIAFRANSSLENSKNIELLNRLGKNAKLVICSASPRNVVERINEIGMDAYWWAPLVDDPRHPDSLTRKMVDATGLPAMNTGGTVGTAAWVFAHMVLNIPRIAVVGMDLGYYAKDTTYFQTQTYHNLKARVGEDKVRNYFPEFVYPSTGELFYTDPTYFWYRKNMLDLVKASGATVYNCTGGGTLVGQGIECLEIEEFCSGL